MGLGLLDGNPVPLWIEKYKSEWIDKSKSDLLSFDIYDLSVGTLGPAGPNLERNIYKIHIMPSLGALAIFFLYKARSDKEHFVTSFLYFITGLNLCFVFQNKEGAFYFIIYIKLYL